MMSKSDTISTREDVYLHMPYGALGDQFCFLGAARIYARRHFNRRIFVSVLPEVVKCYGDGLLNIGNSGRRINVECFSRHRVKHQSPDRNYVGTYLAALSEPITELPVFDPPDLAPCSGVDPGAYIALQPYSSFARNHRDRVAFAQSLVDECHRAIPDAVVYCVGRGDTPKNLKHIDYGHLGGPLEMLRLIQHAKIVLTPRSASAHAAAGYHKRALVWVCGDGEDWHLDYPDWPYHRISVDLSPAEAASEFALHWSKQPENATKIASVSPDGSDSEAPLK